MKEKELNENKRLCLEQLRLSKWQLIWNREHEIRFIEQNDLPLVTRLELEGKMTGEQVMNMKKNLETNIATKRAEMKTAQEEIKLLDKEIEELN